MNSEERFKKILANLLASKEFTFDEANWDKMEELVHGEDDFKGALQESLNSKEFPFDEANWEKAAQMIYASEKPKRVAVYVVSGILLLGTLVTSLYLFNTFFESEEKSLSVVTTTPEIKSLESAITPEINQEVTEVKKTPILNIPKDERATSSKVEALATTTPKELIPSKEAPEKTGESNAPTTKIIPTKIKAVPVTTLNTALDKKVSKAEIPSDDKPNIKVLQTVTIPVLPEEKEKVTMEKSDVVSEKDLNDKTENTQSTVVEITTTNTLADTAPVTLEKKGENIANDVTPINNNYPISVTEESKSVNETATVDQNTTEFDKDKENATKIARDSLVILPMALEELPPDNDQGELGRPKEYPILFSVEAGADYLYGWKNPNSLDAGGFNPVIGINYFNNFKPKMALTVGLQYSSVSNLSYSNYTSRIVRFGFGEESQVTIFTPVKVHYLFMPVRFNYNITPLNTIGIGCNLGYLLNVESEVETYYEKLNTKYDQALTKTNGYTEGFKKYDTQVSLFYKRRLYPNLAINMETFYGLTDIKENKFFNSNVFERNIGLKLTLVYNFLKR